MGKRTSLIFEQRERLLEVIREFCEQDGAGLAKFKSGHSDATIAVQATKRLNIPVSVHNVKGLREQKIGRLRARKEQAASEWSIQQMREILRDLQTRVKELEKDRQRRAQLDLLKVNR